jgi:hypothetical protein
VESRAKCLGGSGYASPLSLRPLSGAETRAVRASFSRLSGRIQAHLRCPSVSGFVVTERKAKGKEGVLGFFLSVRVWYALWKR